MNFDEIERENINILKKTMEALSGLNGKTYEYYFKVYPSSIGLAIKFICEELEIERDITNYNNW